MGAFKPLLPFGNRTVIESSIAKLRDAGVALIVVVAGHRAEELRARLSHLEGLRFALNEETESEMGVSIARGVEAISSDTGAFLVALADQPAIPAADIRKVIDAREQARDKRIFMPEWNGRGGHPVLIDASLRAELLRLDTARGLRGLCDAHRAEVLRVAAGSPYVTRDMDTWDDYHALHIDAFGAPPPQEVGENGARH